MYQHLVFYDGECGLCDHAVQYILKRVAEKNFCFAPLQGETAARLLQDKFRDVDSLILIENYEAKPQIFVEGEAILRICRKLPYPTRMLSAFSIVPNCITNACYRWVARHRKQLMGTTCLLPDPKEPDRFLK
jgi:predicted DCC family thiol-disulfide oxidoreductase YuxK